MEEIMFYLLDRSTHPLLAYARSGLLFVTGSILSYYLAYSIDQDVSNATKDASAW